MLRSWAPAQRAGSPQPQPSHSSRKLREPDRAPRISRASTLEETVATSLKRLLSTSGAPPGSVRGRLQASSSASAGSGPPRFLWTRSTAAASMAPRRAGREEGGRWPRAPWRRAGHGGKGRPEGEPWWRLLGALRGGEPEAGWGRGGGSGGSSCPPAAHFWGG